MMLRDVIDARCGVVGKDGIECVSKYATIAPRPPNAEPFFRTGAGWDADLDGDAFALGVCWAYDQRCDVSLVLARRGDAFGVVLRERLVSVPNLWRLHDYIHQHRMPWVKVATNDLAKDREPIVTQVVIVEDPDKLDFE